MLAKFILLVRHFLFWMMFALALALALGASAYAADESAVGDDKAVEPQPPISDKATLSEYELDKKIQNHQETLNNNYIRLKEDLDLQLGIMRERLGDAHNYIDRLLILFLVAIGVIMMLFVNSLRMQNKASIQRTSRMIQEGKSLLGQIKKELSRPEIDFLRAGQWLRSIMRRLRDGSTIQLPPNLASQVEAYARNAHFPAFLHLLAEALHQEQKNDWKAASFFLQKLYTLEPSDPDVLLHLSHVYRKLADNGSESEAEKFNKLAYEYYSKFAGNAKNQSEQIKLAMDVAVPFAPPEVSEDTDRAVDLIKRQKLLMAQQKFLQEQIKEQEEELVTHSSKLVAERDRLAAEYDKVKSELETPSNAQAPVQTTANQVNEREVQEVQQQVVEEKLTATSTASTKSAQVEESSAASTTKLSKIKQLAQKAKKSFNAENADEQITPPAHLVEEEKGNWCLEHAQKIVQRGRLQTDATLRIKDVTLAISYFKQTEQHVKTVDLYYQWAVALVTLSLEFTDIRKRSYLTEAASVFKTGNTHFADKFKPELASVYAIAGEENLCRELLIELITSGKITKQTLIDSPDFEAFRKQNWFIELTT